MQATVGLLLLLSLVEAVNKPSTNSALASESGKSLQGRSQSSLFELCTGENLRNQAIGHKRQVKQQLVEADLCSDGRGTPLWGVGCEVWCCPAGEIWCAGCAEPNTDKNGCQRCLGGYVLEHGRCTACMDMPGWMDADGDNCFAVATSFTKKCSETRFHGISSNTACCKCGGGLRQATPFAYYSQPMLFGESSVLGWPLPRTAARYSVNKDCQLATYNLTLDGETGRLKLRDGCGVVGCGGAVRQAFQVSCTITAHQEHGLNASAEMSVIADPSMVYDSPVLIVTPNTAHSFTPRTVFAEHKFGITCLPDGIMPWVGISSSNGTITVNAHISEQASGLTALPLPGLEDSVGGLCSVVDTNSSTQTSVIILAPWMWSSIHFPESNLRITVGESALPLLAHAGDGARVSPTRFSMACLEVPDAIHFEFDELTGFGSLNGYGVLSLNVRTGALTLAADSNLTKVFDGLPTAGRSSARLGCTVYGHFEWLAGFTVPRAKGYVLITVLDSTCWKELPEQTWIYEKQDAKDEGQCRADCRAKPSCGIYSFSDRECFFLSRCGTPPVPHCTQKQGKAFEKIPECKESETCLFVKDGSDAVWRYEGRFCPVGRSYKDEADLEWVHRKDAVTAEDSLYLQPASVQDGRLCPTGSLVLREADATRDFFNQTSNYLELYGKRIACLSPKTGGDLLQKVFDDGTQDLTKKTTTDIGADIQLSLDSPTCPEPPLTLADVNGDSQGDQDTDSTDPLPVLLDDPSTTTENDFSLHPCECFPVSWGSNSPVTSDNFQAVPVQTNNRYVPSSIPIVMGAFTCEQRSLIKTVSIASMNEEICQAACSHQESCWFYWFGTLGSLQQCRLYKDCNVLVRVDTATGTLHGLPPTKDEPDAEFCRRANAEACWAVSKRRAFLHAATEQHPEDLSPCIFQSLVQQCDQKLLLGGQGVQNCFGCLYAKYTEGAAWQRKRRLPTSFATGAQLVVSCWKERFQPVQHPEVPGPPPAAHVTLNCVGGSWWNQQDQPALTKFACGACVQVVQPPYASYQEQQRQELYFSSKLVVRLYIDQKQPKAVDDDGHLLSWSDGFNDFNDFNDFSPTMVTVDSDAVPLVQFKTSASHAHKVNKGASRAPRTDRTGFLAEPANATTYGTWRLRSVYNSANCLNADAGGILSSNNCSTKESRRSASQLFSISQVRSALTATLLKDAADSPVTGSQEEEEEDHFDLLWSLSLVRRCRDIEGVLRSLQFHTGQDLENCSVAPFVDISELKRTAIVPGTLQVQRGSRCLSWKYASDSKASYSDCGDRTSKWVMSQQQIHPTNDKSLCVGFPSDSVSDIRKCADIKVLKWDPEGGRLGDYKMGWCLGDASYDDNSQVWWAGTTKCGHEEAHGLAVAQTPGTLECPPGSLLSYVTKEAGNSEVQYQCAFMAAMGSCVQTETPKFAKMDVQFMQTEIWCNDGMALQSIYLQETDDGGAASNSFRYFCCYITGLVSGIVPSGQFHPYGLMPWEGAFCPVDRDVSGRLRYRQRSSFTGAKLVAELFFDLTLGQWCLKSPQSIGTSCVDSQVAEPLDGAELVGPVWQVVAVTDFDGTFAAGGASSAVPKPQRRKPTLVSFSATRPTVREECKEIVPDWDFAKSLSDDNPCKYVSGKKPPSQKEYEDDGATFGKAAWWESATVNTAGPSPGPGGAGYSYSNILGCWSRGATRSLDWLRYEQNADYIKLGSNAAFFGLESTCKLMPDLITAPMGLGTKDGQPKSICESVVKGTQLGLDTGMQITKMVTLRNYKEDDQQDCNGDHAAMARIWCDLHCVRSAVEDGDEAILTSLEGAVKVIDTNVDLLTEYYNGLVSDKVDTVLEAIDELKTMAKPKHQELAELQAGMHRSFGEMKRLAVGLDQTGREAFLRAIDHFKAADGDFSPNATALRFLSDRTDLLHNALKNANAKHKLSQKNAVSQRTAEAAAAMQQLARSRNYLLGVYEHRATRSKERQNRISQDAQGKYNQALSAIGRQLSRLEQYAQRQILADLDSSWWPLRAAFDAYLHAAELQANAFRSAADVLQDYHQCSADFATLRQSYASVQATQQKTHEVLSQTWSTAVTLTGLLVSKLVDSNAFAELAMGEARASLGHVDLCQPEGLSFASAALNSSWYEGLAGQTVRQLTVVFAELGMLKEHLDDLGMEPEDLDVVANAFRRSIELVQTADMAKTSQAKELLADSGCPSEG